MEYVTNYKWAIDRFTTVASLDGPKILISEGFLIPGANARGYFALCHSTPFSGNGISLFLCINDVQTTAAKKPPIIYLWISKKDGKRLGEQKELKDDNGIFNRIECNEFNMCLTSDLYPPTSFLRDDTLVIECQIRVKLDEKTLQVKTRSISLSNVWEGCLVYSGQKQFYVPRDRMMSVSIYFKNLLESDDENAQAGLIQLKNMNDGTFSEFKYLVIFGRPRENLLFDSVQDLYAFAVNYKFDQLKETCKQRLLRVETENNLIICLKLGYIYDDKKLENYSLRKLRERFLFKPEFVYFKSEEWIKFAAEDLSLALMIKVAIYKAVGTLPMNYSLHDSE